MRVIAALLLTISFLSPAFAAPIYGVLNVTHNKFYILQDKQKFEIVSHSADAVRDINRLSSGDFVAFEGYYNFNEKKVFVTSVDWVGLKKIIGVWRTSDNKVLEFQDYTTLMLHNYDDDAFPVARKKPGTLPLEPLAMSYRMAPGSGNSWTLFVSERKKLFLGRVNINGHNLSIAFFDNNSGKVVKTLKLTRLFYLGPYFEGIPSDEYL